MASVTGLWSLGWPMVSRHGRLPSIVHTGQPHSAGAALDLGTLAPSTAAPAAWKNALRRVIIRSGMLSVYGGAPVDPWVTVLVCVVTALVAAVGWLVARNHTLNQLVGTQRDTIDTLKRQVDRMEITAELTDKFFSQALPQPRAPGEQR